MKVTIEKATVDSVVQDGNGFKSTLYFKSNGHLKMFSLPVKLDVGNEVSVDISVEINNNAVSD